MLVYILAGFVAYLSLKNYERVEFNELTKENKWLKIFYKNSAIFVLVVVLNVVKDLIYKRK